ncbi:hypothetical protein PT974_00085 [Cladobotryum mycophilum]|uniref:Zn(2)-C6 fungal-type domain-containing protein n=1 Tax=Cladobotryum mycophilum TaxID=491253 RepID=A0ABR0T033_9HYPO
MFSTFKYDPETREVQELRSAFDPVTARSSQHQACNNCHAKKLKCSGEKSGCERCATSQLVCEYTRSNSRSSRRGKKASGRSSTDSRTSGDHLAGDSSPGSQSGSKPSTSTSSRHQQKASRRHSRQAGGKASSLSPPRDTTILDRLDPALLGPDDGFDLRSLSIGSEHEATMVTTGAEYTASVAAYASHHSEYYPQPPQQHAGSWQHASQDSYIVTSAGVDPSYLSTVGPEGYSDQEYYGQYPDYTSYQHHHDPRYWQEEH